MDDIKAVLVITVRHERRGVCIARGHRPSCLLLQGAGRLQEGGLPRAVVYVLARSLRRPVSGGGPQTQVSLHGGPLVPQKQDDGSLQKWRPQQREHPPQE